VLYNIGDHVALAEAGEESWGVVGQSVRLHNSFWGRRRVLGRTRRRVRRRVHVRGGQPLQAYLHRGVRGALLPRHARHCRSRPDRRVGQTTRQKSGAAAHQQRPPSRLTPASRRSYLGQTPTEATIHSSRRMGRHIYTYTMTGMRHPWAPRQNGWDYRSCPGSHTMRPGHARAVNS
jgi:hypothetical protein